MNLVTSVTAVFRKYADFTGTADRPEFWLFALFSAVAHAALNAFNIYTDQGTFYLGSSLSGAFSLIVLVPTLAVTVRRLRDTGRSWAELFWLLLPVVGLIILIVHLAERGTGSPQPQTPPPAPAPTAQVT